MLDPLWKILGVPKGLQKDAWKLPILGYIVGKFAIEPQEFVPDALCNLDFKTRWGPFAIS